MANRSAKLTGQPCCISDSGSMSSPGGLFDQRLNERGSFDRSFFLYCSCLENVYALHESFMGWTNRNRQRSVCLKSIEIALAPEQSFPQTQKTNQISPGESRA